METTVSTVVERTLLVEVPVEATAELTGHKRKLRRVEDEGVLPAERVQPSSQLVDLVSSSSQLVSQPPVSSSSSSQQSQMMSYREMRGQLSPALRGVLDEFKHDNLGTGKGVLDFLCLKNGLAAGRGFCFLKPTYIGC